jgi:signal transduction histidine kinase
VQGQVRSLSRGLVPGEVDPAGLAAALEELAARTRAQAGVDCTFTGSGPVQVPDTACATHLLRIAQEAVNNALRHARARHVRIALHAEADRLTLSVEDDGVGLAGPAGERGGVSRLAVQGLGIRLMRYRAGLIGGTLAVGPAPGGGTRVSCTLRRGSEHGSE